MSLAIEKITCSYCDGPTRTGNKVVMLNEASCLVLCGACEEEAS